MNYFKYIFLLILILSLIPSTNASAPNITLLSQTPSEIYQNSTGYINITYGITHEAVGLNGTSVSFIYRNYDYSLSDSNHSIRVPGNNLSAVWEYNGKILRAANRNETLNFENNDTITEGDIYSWSGLDENNTRLTIVPVNSTYTKVYISSTLHKFMPQMWYLDRTDLQEAPKTQLGIHKSQKVLIKFWNFEIFKGYYDYLGVGYTDTSLKTSPAHQPSDANPINYYYINSSYDPTTGGDPLISGYAVYMGSLNASGWIDHVYKPHANSSYVRGFINGSLLHSYINTTKISYLYFTSNTPSSKPYYINVTNAPTSTNVSFADTNVLWVGNIAPYTPQSYTPNNWFAFMKDNISFDHKIYAADNNGQWANSTLNSTFIGKAFFPPTKPTFYSFHDGFTDRDMNGTYDSVFDIQIGPSSDPDGGIVTHNLTLHYGSNHIYVATINNTFISAEEGVFANISFDSTPYYSTDNYTLRVIATDDESESVTVWLSVNFSLGVETIPIISKIGSTWINWSWDSNIEYNVWIDGKFSGNTSLGHYLLTDINPREQHTISLVRVGLIAAQNTARTFYPLTLFLLSFTIMWGLLLTTLFLKDESSVIVFGTISFIVGTLNFYLTFPYYFSILSYMCIGTAVIALLWVMMAAFSLITKGKNVEEDII